MYVRVCLSCILCMCVLRPVAGLDFDRGLRLGVGLDLDRYLSRGPLLIGIKVGPGPFLFIATNVLTPVWILIVI